MLVPVWNNNGVFDTWFVIAKSVERKNNSIIFKPFDCEIENELRLPEKFQVIKSIKTYNVLEHLS